LLALLLHQLLLLVLEHLSLPDGKSLKVVSLFETAGVEELRRIVCASLIYRIVLDELLNYQRIVVVSLSGNQKLVEWRHGKR
jgi:hypothetical protein